MRVELSMGTRSGGAIDEIQIGKVRPEIRIEIVPESFLKFKCTKIAET